MEQLLNPCAPTLVAAAAPVARTSSRLSRLSATLKRSKSKSPTPPKRSKSPEQQRSIMKRIQPNNSNKRNSNGSESSSSKPSVVRQVSGLGMEDPVVQRCAAAAAADAGGAAAMEASFSSIASDPTADGESTGFDITKFHASLADLHTSISEFSSNALLQQPKCNSPLTQHLQKHGKIGGSGKKKKSLMASGPFGKPKKYSAAAARAMHGSSTTAFLTLSETSGHPSSHSGSRQGSSSGALLIQTTPSLLGASANQGDDEFHESFMSHGGDDNSLALEAVFEDDGETNTNTKTVSSAQSSKRSSLNASKTSSSQARPGRLESCNEGDKKADTATSASNATPAITETSGEKEDDDDEEASFQAEDLMGSQSLNHDDEETADASSSGAQKEIKLKQEDTVHTQTRAIHLRKMMDASGGASLFGRSLSDNSEYPSKECSHDSSSSKRAGKRRGRRGRGEHPREEEDGGKNKYTRSRSADSVLFDSRSSGMDALGLGFSGLDTPLLMQAAMQMKRGSHGASDELILAVLSQSIAEINHDDKKFNGLENAPVTRRSPKRETRVLSRQRLPSRRASHGVSAPVLPTIASGDGTMDTDIICPKSKSDGYIRNNSRRLSPRPTTRTNGGSTCSGSSRRSPPRPMSTSLTTGSSSLSPTRSPLSSSLNSGTTATNASNSMLRFNSSSSHFDLPPANPKRHYDDCLRELQKVESSRQLMRDEQRNKKVGCLQELESVQPIRQLVRKEQSVKKQGLLSELSAVQPIRKLQREERQSFKKKVLDELSTSGHVRQQQRQELQAKEKVVLDELSVSGHSRQQQRTEQQFRKQNLLNELTISQHRRQELRHQQRSRQIIVLDELSESTHARRQSRRDRSFRKRELLDELGSSNHLRVRQERDSQRRQLVNELNESQHSREQQKRVAAQQQDRKRGCLYELVSTESTRSPLQKKGGDKDGQRRRPRPPRRSYMNQSLSQILANNSSFNASGGGIELSPTRAGN